MSWLRCLSLALRLGLGFGLVMGLLLLAVGLSIMRLDHLGEELQYAERQARRAHQVEAWKQLTDLNADRTMALVVSGGHEALSALFAQRMKDASARISELQQALERSLDDEADKRLFAEVADKRSAYVEARKAVFERQKAGEQAAATELAERRLAPAAAAYISAIGGLRERTDAEAARHREAAMAAVARTRLWLLALAAGCLLLGAAAAWLISTSVTRPLAQAVAATAAMADGDLSRPLADDGRGDEVGRLLASVARMQQSLRGIVAQVRSASESIATGAAQVAAGNNDLSQRTESTAGRLQQSAAALHQLATSVEGGAGAARAAGERADAARGAVQQGAGAVQRVVGSMGTIATHSRRIADISGAIEGIAFQTNILALNAAVEAARAGEHGRGFAVVAAEVRQLAQRSAQAAREISGLVGESVDSVEAGQQRANEAAGTMAHILREVESLSALATQIGGGALEQGRGIGEVNQAVAQLDAATQQNAALVEEATAAADSLNSQAQRLVAAVGVFRLGQAA